MRYPYGLSPDDVERLTGLRRRYVRRLIDSGEIEGFRVGRYRRVHPQKLLAWLRARNLPTDRLETYLPLPCPAVLVLTSAPFSARDLLAATEDVSQACDLFQAVYLLTRREYRFVVIDTAIGWPETERLLGWIRRYRPLSLIACLVYEDDGAYPDRWQGRDWVKRWAQPVQWSDVAEYLRTLAVSPAPEPADAGLAA